MSSIAKPTSPTRMPPHTADAERVSPRRLIAYLMMCVGMFMAFLDIQIVSASMSEIQAGLAASSDEISWVQTAYLIAEVVAIPLSGFFSRALGTRLMFATAAAGFTAASLMCGLVSSMNEMIVWRAAQGFIGGGMIPSVFACAYTVFPRSKQPLIIPMVGLIATLAPTIGPTVGGYITDRMSWHWLFFVNVVPGIVVATSTFALIDFDRPNFALFDQFDWFGAISMAGFLGALEYVLEEGPRWDWLEDPTIELLAVISTVSAVAFFIRALTARSPIVDIRAYANRNFALGSMFSFVIGIGLFGLVYLYPLYLARIRGYDALMIGEAMFVSGLAMFLSAPVVSSLMRRIDPRLMIAAGLVIFAISPWLMASLTKDWDFWELLWPQIFRGVGLMFALVPITDVALGTLPAHRLQNASSLFNLSRNLGGAVGLAIINTLLDNRTDLHLARLHEAINSGRQPVVELLAKLTARFHYLGSDAPSAALRQLMLLARQQGMVMGFADVFLMLAVLTAAACPFTILMQRPSMRSSGGGH